MTHIVQRLMCMALLLGCVTVSLGNCDDPRYIPWAIFSIFITLTVGTVFILQTIQERK